MVELRKAADIAPNTMTRIRKNEEVSLDVLGRISILMLIMDMKSISIFTYRKCLSSVLVMCETFWMAVEKLDARLECEIQS